MMAKSRNYRSDLLESLKDPVEAAEYLNAALEEGEAEVFLLALRDVVESYGGMSKLAASTSLNRENLYRMLSIKGNPEFFSLSSVLSAVGFRLAVEPKTVDLPETSRSTSKIVLHTYPAQVKEPAPQYSLAADTDPRQKIQTVLRTFDNKEAGTLEFDYTDGTLVFYVTGDIRLGAVHEVEIQTQDGRTLTGEALVQGKNRLGLLRKKKVFPKDVSQITLTVVD
jgi:probable addiction module antidote protein